MCAGGRVWVMLRGLEGGTWEVNEKPTQLKKRKKMRRPQGKRVLIWSVAE